MERSSVRSATGPGSRSDRSCREGSRPKWVDERTPNRVRLASARTTAAECCQWREGRDSNPRGSFTPPTRLAGGRFRPLSHLPAKVADRFYPAVGPRPNWLQTGRERIIRAVQAPGGPGATPTWGPGNKQGFGTAPTRESRVWFTLARGSLSEVFHPTLDQPLLHQLRFLAAAPGTPPIDLSAEATHEVRW